MTRQYKWQIKMVREGKCKICGVPAVTKLYCEKHRLAANARTYEAAHKRRYEAAQYVSANNAGKIFHFPKWLLAEPFFLHASQGREDGGRLWQIRCTSGKTLAAEDKEGAPLQQRTAGAPGNRHCRKLIFLRCYEKQHSCHPCFPFVYLLGFGRGEPTKSGQFTFDRNIDAGPHERL